MIPPLISTMRFKPRKCISHACIFPLSYLKMIASQHVQKRNYHHASPQPLPKLNTAAIVWLLHPSSRSYTLSLKSFVDCTRRILVLKSQPPYWRDSRSTAQGMRHAGNATGADSIKGSQALINGLIWLRGSSGNDLRCKTGNIYAER